MKTILDKSLAEIVRENFKAVTVFEKYQLDFCCKGKRSLAQACHDKQLMTEQIIKELEAVSQDKKPGEDFSKMSMGELINYIIDTHHTYVKSESVQLAAYLQKIASKHGQRHLELFNIFEIFVALKEEMELHMQKEEYVLFPRIKELECLKLNTSQASNLSERYIQYPILMMEKDHDHAGAHMEEIRKLTNNYTAPDDACTTYRLSFAALQAFEINLHQHVHLENNILFPGTIRLVKEMAPILSV